MYSSWTLHTHAQCVCTDQCVSKRLGNRCAGFHDPSRDMLVCVCALCLWYHWFLYKLSLSASTLASFFLLWADARHKPFDRCFLLVCPPQNHGRWLSSGFWVSPFFQTKLSRSLVIWNLCLSWSARQFSQLLGSLTISAGMRGKKYATSLRKVVHSPGVLSPRSKHFPTCSLGILWFFQSTCGPGVTRTKVHLQKQSEGYPQLILKIHIHLRTSSSVIYNQESKYSCLLSIWIF